MLLCFGAVNAQQITIQGNVKGDGVPLPGANISIKETNKTTISDFDGNFEIKANQGQKIEISYMGFITKVIVANANKTKINVNLETDSFSLDAVTLIGYGKQKKIEVTGAVANVQSDEISKTPVADVGAAIQGKVAGVNVQAANGRPGESANIQIRGLGSLSVGASGPLYVVDGIPQQGNPNIAPDQIESMDILKDGASAAIYGVRASNGVILITTKRGEEGKMKIELNSYAGIQNITSGTPVTNTAQEFYVRNVVGDALNVPNDILYFNPNALHTDTDFIDEITENNQLVQNHNLSISGGTKNLSINFNSSYFEQEGVVVNSGFDRFAHRLNGQFNKGKFKAFISLGLTTENSTVEPWEIYNLAMQQNSYRPSINSLTSNGDSGVNIPVQNEIQYSYLSSQLVNTDERKVDKTNLAINLEYEIIKGLKYKVNYGKNTYNFVRKYYQPQYLAYDRTGSLSELASRKNARLEEFINRIESSTLENILNYDFEIGRHKIGLLGVISYEKYETHNRNFGTLFAETTSNDLQGLGSGSEALRPGSYIANNTLAGKLFRAQYGFDEKYLFSASYRRDGSSRFSKENRYSDFFGISAGWNINKERFFKNLNIEAINNLKLRLSYAELGNQNIPDYAYQSVLSSNINYPFATGADENLQVGFTQTAYANENIVWESSISRNIGLDLAMFRNRLNISAEYYQNDKESMLLGINLPASTGVFTPLTLNAGDMTNKGLELAINYKDETEGGLKYNIGFTFTQNNNEITDLNGIERGYANGSPTWGADNLTYLAEGYEAGAFFLVKTDGVIKTQEQLDTYKAIDGGAQLGDMMYVDQDGNSQIDENDRIYMGSGQADFNTGLNLALNYKNFDVNVQTYFSYGAEIFNGSKYFAYRNGQHEDIFYQWSPQNPNSDIPTSRRNSSHNNVRAWSDQYLEDGTYFRIRNLVIGYTLPKALTEKLKINKARIYGTSVNPFTFTKYSGYDPEVGGDGLFYRGVDRGNYPVTRQFMLGLQLSF